MQVRHRIIDDSVFMRKNETEIKDVNEDVSLGRSLLRDQSKKKKVKQIKKEIGKEKLLKFINEQITKIGHFYPAAGESVIKEISK